MVQKYIEKPLLYSNRKFDIRVWALFLEDRVYFYEKGYIRTSSDVYSLNNLNNYVHLTNNCLQKLGENYNKYEEGNTISFTDFEGFLLSFFAEKVDFRRDIVKRIIDLIIDAFLASKEAINPNKRKEAFELLGFDFLVDEDLRTWLIEINTNPYLGIPNEYIRGLMGEMINDMLEIVIDQRFPPVESFKASKIRSF